jgi:hypothetical protein
MLDVVQRIRGITREVQQYCDNLAARVDEICRIPTLRGNLIDGVTLSTSVSGTVVSHGLGRAYRGWIVVRVSAATAPIIDELASSDATKALVLRTSQACTVSVWVF